MSKRAVDDGWFTTLVKGQELLCALEVDRHGRWARLARIVRRIMARGRRLARTVDGMSCIGQTRACDVAATPAAVIPQNGHHPILRDNALPISHLLSRERCCRAQAAGPRLQDGGVQGDLRLSRIS